MTMSTRLWITSLVSGYLAVSTTLTPAIASPHPVLPLVAVKAATYTPPTPEDLSDLSWSTAFDRLADTLAAEYAFTTWKGLDWAALEAEFAPKVAAAEAAGDHDAYVLALRSFVHRTRDGHVSITATPDLLDRMVGASYGVILTRLTSGAVAATWVTPGGPAQQAGIEVGSRMIRWNGLPIDTAVARTSTVMSPQQPTDERRDRERLRMLARGPVGATAEVAFTVPGARGVRTETLRAVDDDLRTLKMTNEQSKLSTFGWPQRAVTSRILPGNVGYVQVLLELDLPAEVPGDHTPTLRLFRSAIADFIRRDVDGIVLDIRGNAGGSDQMAADLLGSFTAKPSFYEYQNYLVPGTGRFQIWVGEESGAFVRRGSGLMIKPAPPVYTGPVVALVDNGCVSSGEGLAMGVKRLPNGTVVGFTGTNGSFGMVGAGVRMPGGLEIGWPFGQSLDERKIVQIDSRYGRGGVTPDVLVPSTVANWAAHWAGEDVELDVALRVIRGSVAASK